MALYDINDDCLLKIFRMLSLDDLLWVADTCSRFRALAVRAFTLSHSRRRIDFNEWYNDETETFDMLQITRLLTKLGSLITGIECIQYDSFSRKQCQDILNAILMYCYDGNLKRLKLVGLWIDGVSTAKLPSLCANLEALELRHCTLYTAFSNQLFSNCNKLTKLNIDFSILEANAFDSFYPQLQTLALYGKINEITKVEKFLKGQNELRVLKIQIRSMFSYRIINAINDFCSSNLKSLTIEDFFFTGDTFHPKLRELINKLESLEMNYVFWRSYDALISECKKLQTLKLSSVYNFYKAFEDTSFPELKHFEMDRINNDDRERALTILQKSKKLQKLDIILDVEVEGKQFCDIVVNNLKELKSIRVFQDGVFHNLASGSYMPLSELQNVNKLEIFNRTTCDWTIFFKSMASIESVRYMNLVNVLVDNDSLAAIAKFTNLLQLEMQSLDHMGSNASVRNNSLRLEPLRSLSQLSALKLVGEWRISHTDLINVVNKLEQLKSLTVVRQDFMAGCETYQQIIEICRNKGQDLAIHTEYHTPDSLNSYIDIERDSSI